MQSVGAENAGQGPACGLALAQVRGHGRTINYRLFALNWLTGGVAHGFDGHGARCHFVVAKDQREAGAAGVRLFHLALETATARVLGNREAAVAQRFSELASGRACGVTGMNEVGIQRRQIVAVSGVDGLQLRAKTNFKLRLMEP